jgi:Leucine-rich repeat (LRR) protein
MAAWLLGFASSQGGTSSGYWVRPGPDTLVDMCSWYCNCDLKTMTVDCSANNAHFDHFPKGLMNSNMTTFILDNNKIPSIPAGAFGTMTLIKHLSINNNEIASIDPQAFSTAANPYLAGLLSLKLSHNRLTTVSPTLLAPLVNLEAVELAHNRFTTLPGTLFSGLTALRTIALEGSQLTTIPANLFAGMANMTILTMFHNKLTAIPPGALLHAVKLKYFYAHGNKLTTMPSNLFQSAGECLRVKLSNNSLSTLQPDAFTGLRSLEQLHLDQNLLTTMSGSSFNSMTKLQILNLSHNTPMARLPRYVFDQMPAMERCFMNDCALAVLPPGLFRTQVKLLTLKLHNNKLSNMGVAHDVFSGLAKLERLDLDFVPYLEYFCPIPSTCRIMAPHHVTTVEFDRPCVCESRLCAAASRAAPPHVLAVTMSVLVVARSLWGSS